MIRDFTSFTPPLPRGEGRGEDGISPKWLQETRRRCNEIDCGKMPLLDGVVVIKELREKYICE